MSGLDPLARLERAAPDDTRAAASALEAYFLRQLLAEVRGSSEEGALDGGFAGSTFREMLDGALADAMASAGGVGLAGMLEGSLAAGAPPKNGLPPPKNGLPPPKNALPVEGVTTSPFGRRTDPVAGGAGFHTGVDLQAAAGTPVRATAPGTVRHAGPAGSYGNLVIVDHGGGLETRYAHLASIVVRPGDRLRAGESIGSVGATGRATGPHLHFELRRDGKPLDPLGKKSPLKLPR